MLSIQKLRSNYGLMSNMLLDIISRFSNAPDPNARAYGARVQQLFDDTRTDEELTEYIILSKAEFPAANIVNLLNALGVTPERIVELARTDAYVNAILLEAGFLVDEQSTLSDDNMVQIFKILMFKNYEGQL